MCLVLVGAISVSRSYWHWNVSDVTKYTNYTPEKGIEVKACNCAILSCGRKEGCVCAAGNIQISKHFPHQK